MFSADPGKGKTTIAALLQTHGYQLISDDFVSIDRNSFSAFPFPIAMSVKQSSMALLSELFPDLEQQTLTYISPEKSVRYLPPNHFDVTQSVFPVREFIFIEYNSSVDFIWKKLDPLKVIKLLLVQSWISPTQGNASILFDRISQTSFYQLTYSNNQKALDAITNSLIMTNKELFYFTGKCLMLDEDPGFKLEIVRKIEVGSIDWLKFLALCSNYFVLPAIYLKFQAHRIIEYLPEEFSEYLKYIYDLNLSRNTHILE